MGLLTQYKMNQLTLNQVTTFPDQLLEISANELYTIFPDPTLMHLEGKCNEPLFISILQHGNEVTGLKVIQRLLSEYKNVSLPRSVSIFFGNSQAARYGKRVLDNKPDYNRVWPGSTEPYSEEMRVMQSIVDEMKNRNVFASIDIHNNTGLNPYYACINKLGNQFLQLASLFGHTVVYFLTPKGVQSSAFSMLCPAVTIECGRPDLFGNVDQAFDYVKTILHLENIKNDSIPPQNINLFHTVARVTIPDDASISFKNNDADIFLMNDLDKMNFIEVPIGTCLGKISSENAFKLIALDENEQEVSDKYFLIEDNKIKTKIDIMPAMLTLNEEVIKQDCLCYLMERII
jgi:succinylglutamate desuccinylase